VQPDQNVAGSGGKTGDVASSLHYQSAKVTSNNQFDHQQELKELNGQRIDDHTFGN